MAATANVVPVGELGLPELHQKDLLVKSDYPLYEKFAKLSRQEEDWELLDNWKAISDHNG